MVEVFFVVEAETSLLCSARYLVIGWHQLAILFVPRCFRSRTLVTLKLQGVVVFLSEFLHYWSSFSIWIICCTCWGRGLTAVAWFYSFLYTLRLVILFQFNFRIAWLISRRILGCWATFYLLWPFDRDIFSDFPFLDWISQVLCSLYRRSCFFLCLLSHVEVILPSSKFSETYSKINLSGGRTHLSSLS